MKKIVIGVLIAIVLVFLVLQLVPLGKQHANPPVAQEPAWDSLQTRQLAQRACFDCHSNQTVWPWYSRIAPISWLITNDVLEGRSRVNFSQWGHGEQEVEEIGEAVQEGEMPPSYYMMLHPGANLSAAEKTELIKGFSATFGGSLFEGEEGGDEGDD